MSHRSAVMCLLPVNIGFSNGLSQSSVFLALAGRNAGSGNEIVQHHAYGGLLVNCDKNQLTHNCYLLIETIFYKMSNENTEDVGFFK